MLHRNFQMHFISTPKSHNKLPKNKQKKKLFPVNNSFGIFLSLSPPRCLFSSGRSSLQPKLFPSCTRHKTTTTTRQKLANFCCYRNFNWASAKKTNNNKNSSKKSTLQAYNLCQLSFLSNKKKELRKKYNKINSKDFSK